MSKERALLKEIIRHFAEGGLAIIASNSDVARTLFEAKELLAQPEQVPETKQEPVILNTKDAELSIYDVCFTTMLELQDLKQSLLKHEQTEQEPVAWKDRTYGNLHHVDWGDSMPLYALEKWKN